MTWWCLAGRYRDRIEAASHRKSGTYTHDEKKSTLDKTLVPGDLWGSIAKLEAVGEEHISEEVMILLDDVHADDDQSEVKFLDRAQCAFSSAVEHDDADERHGEKEEEDGAAIEPWDALVEGWAVVAAAPPPPPPPPPPPCPPCGHLHRHHHLRRRETATRRESLSHDCVAPPLVRSQQ